MYGQYFSGFVRRGAVTALFVMLFIGLIVEYSVAGMLVAEGKHSHYVANQEEGVVYIVYGDGEWVQFADGFGYISGLCSAPDKSLYVLSGSQRRLYRVAADGMVQTVCKVGSSPQAIFVDRDGDVKFVQRKGVVTEIK
ncbi:hypothetical protein [Maridesulfovibrio sp.]|uniref:hypothetical protein n=1 Tax=Maridesulfovibrio sp. TaxID=2795000 RepID=UPI0029C9E869|nr:hypothetical protein [Maridesulfovibrio sp.]